MNLNEFGRLLQQYCKRLGTNWEQLAKEAGIDHSTLSKNAHGPGRPSQATLHKLVTAMQKHEGWLPIYEQPLYTIVYQGTDELHEQALEILISMERKEKEIWFPREKKEEGS